MIEFAGDTTDVCIPAVLLDRERELRAQFFPPPPDLRLSEWADEFRMVSSVASAFPGRWRTSMVPYLREFMDTITDPDYEEIVLCAASQVAKTEGGILNPLGYFIHLDPSPILVVQPNVEPMAKDFSKRRLDPMVRESPVLRALSGGDSGRREKDNTIQRKEFLNGASVTIVGANSAAGLSSLPIRVVLFDECDRYPASAGDEGDPIALGRKRTTTFWNRKIVKVSSPTIKGASRIWKDFERGDMRFFFVPCPACGEMQKLEWKQITFNPVGYRCIACELIAEEVEKPAMLQKGEWRKTHPGRAVASFHISSLYSPFTTWAEIIARFEDAGKTPELVQTFVNTELAECFELRGVDAAETDSLVGRKVDEPADVPDGVGLLTAFVDVQGDRLELLVVGWGRMQESWLLFHYVVYGDPAQQQAWDDLDLLAKKSYCRANGAEMFIRRIFVDSGYLKAPVYGYVRTRQRPRDHTAPQIWASRGMTERGRNMFQPSKKPHMGVQLYMLNVDAAKDVLFARLKITADGSARVNITKRISDDAVRQFSAETVVIRYHKGVAVAEYHQKNGARNELIDCWVGAYLALLSLGPAVYDNLGLLVDRARAMPAVAGNLVDGADPGGHAAPLPPTAPPAPPRRISGFAPRPGGYVKGW